jgi:hypothetical protein
LLRAASKLDVEPHAAAGNLQGLWAGAAGRTCKDLWDSAWEMVTIRHHNLASRPLGCARHKA